jgi:hypothetical protein
MRGEHPAGGQARVLRAHYRRLAGLFAERCIDALLDEDYPAAARWSSAYHLAASRCRALGELARTKASVQQPVGTH